MTGVKYKVKKSGDVQVEIGLSKPAKIKYKRLKSQNLIYVDLYRSKLKRSVKRDMIVSPQAFVKKIQAAQNTKDKVRVVCRLMEGVKYTVGIVSNPTNIVVNLKRKKGKKKRKVAPLRLKKTSPMDSADLVDLARMMDEAQLALEEKKYDQAIRLYGKVLKKPENPFTPEAMEFIGVAREKKGQTARARSEYKKYLRRYPANDGTSRVRDRLKALGKKAARLKLMLNDAKGAFDQGDYGAAIKLFTELLEKGAYREVSLELLGQSYEMNGQSSSAIDEFTRYLQFYPEGPGADRVNARLKALWERDKRAGGKFEEAGKALTGGEYERSARMYKSLLSSEKHKKQSLEFLGLSYEKGGKLERAVSVYKEYLQLYPKEEGSSRVRQRLAGLQTAKVAPKKKLKKVKKRADRVDFYGSFSQSYDRDDDFVFLQERIPNSSSLTSDINLNYRARKEVYDIRAIFTGGHEYDLLEGENEVRLRRFYYDLKHKPKKMSMRLGRQKSSSGGVFSRFDGGNFGVGLNEVLKLNLVTGFPMDTTKLSTYETRKYFLGLNMDIGTFKDSWDFNVFGINQMVEGMIDRQGVGGEVRYFYDRKSIFGYVDYDVFFNELNVFLLSGNLTFIGNITINFSLDYRKSPLLTTSNAIQGQNVDSPEDLKDSFTESEIHKLAQARTATNKSFLFGFSHPVTERLQIAGDV
ncbi:MAG: tetratricopeptide repeat protein, partial [Nitrospinota bacterium]